MRALPGEWLVMAIWYYWARPFFTHHESLPISNSNPILLYIGLLGMTQLMRKFQLALRLILKGSPDQRLNNVPSEGHESKPSAQFLG